MQAVPTIFPVSIVIPSYNRAAILQDTIAQVLRQPFRNYELWVIDQSGTDDAQANAKYVEELNDPRLHYLYLNQSGLPNARNEALVRTRGEIVLFLDDDVILLSEDFIGAHVDAYQDPAVGGVVGRHVERSLRINSRRTACHVSWSGRTIFNLFGTERVEVRSCKGSNMSFRMAVVNEVGGFDRRTEMLEETDYSTRVRAAGWHLIFEPRPKWCIYPRRPVAFAVRINYRLNAAVLNRPPTTSANIAAFSVSRALLLRSPSLPACARFAFVRSRQFRCFTRRCSRALRKCGRGRINCCRKCRRCSRSKCRASATLSARGTPTKSNMRD